MALPDCGVLAVLTKADLVATKAEITHWLDVITGRVHPLKHGYYCTRQPDDDERANGVTQEEARALETSFFANTAPWAHHASSERFGTQNLVTNLRRLIVDRSGKR